MEFQATVGRQAPDALVNALNRLRPDYQRLVCEHFGVQPSDVAGAKLIVPSVRIQEDDAHIVHLKVSEVTLTDKPRDFDGLNESCAKLLDATCERHWPDAHVSLHVVVVLYEPDHLMESDHEVLVVDKP